ncbi:hypothetical protein LWI29_035254 [Acer saccharum]|uniref:Uncharacterized protein n=1 Tax=Acer saccharum TaxID=4024 RepID=A0AA39TKD2_ACESA|nr:hypothetical protein LWI29_035254 [Acer saccharum]
MGTKFRMAEIEKRRFRPLSWGDVSLSNLFRRIFPRTNPASRVKSRILHITIHRFESCEKGKGMKRLDVYNALLA